MSTYTIARYEHKILLVEGIWTGAGHAFWVLEEILPDGAKQPLAAIHGLATDALGNAKEVGYPWEFDDTIQAHVYSALSADDLGLENDEIVKWSNVDSTGNLVGANFLIDADTVRRSDMGEMTLAEATAAFQDALDVSSLINVEKAPYSIIPGT